MSRYPTFPFEGSAIRSLRLKAQKEYENEELFAFYVIRPWSLYLSLLIVKKTKLSANTITFFMMISSFLGILILASITGKLEFFIACPALFLFLYVLDVLDGEVARLRGVISNRGQFYDAGLWFSLPLIFVVFVDKCVEYYPLPVMVLEITYVTIMFELFLLVSQSLFSSDRSILMFLQKRENNFLTRVLLFTKFILSKQIVYIVVLLLSLLDNYVPVSTIIASYLCLTILSYNVYSFYKFYKILNNLADATK